MRLMAKGRRGSWELIRARSWQPVPVLCQRKATKERHSATRQDHLRPGKATVRLAWGAICRAKVHWYEAHGIGRRKFKIKRFLE